MHRNQVRQKRNADDCNHKAYPAHYPRPFVVLIYDFQIYAFFLSTLINGKMHFTIFQKQSHYSLTASLLKSHSLLLSISKVPRQFPLPWQSEHDVSIDWDMVQQRLQYGVILSGGSIQKK